MARKTLLDRAIAEIESEIEVLQKALARLQAQRQVQIDARAEKAQ